ncbi:kinase-like domain-containing protein [Mycena epipterygia]|nr:kinase-like domain-containing protein [Mycena epipterygia]
MSLGERCDACGSTTALSASPHTVPRIEIHSLDMIPFSDSFSGLFEEYDDGDEDGENEDEVIDHDQQTRNEMSYNVEQFSNVKDLDPAWDDDDVEEVMVLSPKQQQYSKLSTISEEHDACCDRSSQISLQADPVVTLADFDIIPTSEYPVLCRRRSTNKVYVIKALEPSSTSSEPHIEQVVMEAIRALRAPFLERVHWSFPGVIDSERGRTYLVLESHSGGSLMSLMNSGPISPADVLFYVDGISFLHAANIIHRDLTPSNIIVDRTGHIVLSNFCNATMLTANKRCTMPPSAAMEYQAPEILLGWAHDFAVDCWSLGLLLHFLSAGTNPVASDADVKSQILNGDLVVSDILPLPAKDLIMKCVERNPILRLSIRSTREHAYFTTVDWRRVRQQNIPAPTRSLTTSPKLRPLSQDFPLPPASRLSHSLDTSLDISFTFHTASKAVPSQPRLERVRSRGVNDVPPPIRSFCSMDDLRSGHKRNRLSLTISPISNGTPRHHTRHHSMQDAGPPSSCPTETTAADPFHPFSPRLNLQIQTPESLPKIFRSTLLDDRLVKEEEPPHPSPVISSPTVCELSPRERMAQFWETIDAEGDQESGSSVSSLELRDALKLALPCPPLPTPRPRRSRKRASSSAFPLPQPQPEQRFSILSSTQATNKLRKLRRPSSTPLLSKQSEPILNLPSGVEQIGKGIGFTYKIRLASHSKASICTTAAPSAVGKLLRSGLGLGKGLLRRAKSYPKFSSSGGMGGRTRSPPANIQTSPHFTSTVVPDLNSPMSDGPLTPDSTTFPPLPEIVGDPFAKDDVGEEARNVGPDVTLRLVRVPPSDYRLPFSTTMQPLDNFIFSSWNT